MSEPFRGERTGIEFPRAAWMSFDRYDRYGAIARCLRASLGEGRHRVLDVGDAAGYLELFAGHLRLVGVDISVQPERLPGSVALAGDGARLPFADRTFDAVVSSDVLEHVRPDFRPQFIDELSRVSRDLVIIAAPFDTDGVAGVEELIRRFALLATATPQEQLEEHRDRTLPVLDDAVARLALHGEVVTTGNGNLWDWLELMLVKHQLIARPALQPLHDGIDALYNLSLAGRAAEGPFYRHLLAARRDAPVQLGTLGAAPIPSTTMAGILANLVGAAGPESARQNTEPRLDELLGEVAGLRSDLAEIGATVGARLDAIEHHQLALFGPLRKARAAFRRVALPHEPAAPPDDSR